MKEEMYCRCTSREAIFEPDVLIWTSGGRIPASNLVDVECRWVDNNVFQIKTNGKWWDAQSTDFIFNN